ncbi:MAG TPA: hypothetical protein VLD37_02835 [Candidatus Bilamarchaeum sp.]|nr:hypothetical protein [Candidatus Bilamarchaeum sp.]
MYDLFSMVGERVGSSANRIFAVHNAVVDDVFEIAMTRADFNRCMGQRFGDESETHRERLGGGGINFALTASSLGHPGAYFVGFMDRCAKCLAERIKKASDIRLPLVYSLTPQRRNSVVELLDDNLLFHNRSSSSVDTGWLAARLRAFSPSGSDWLASMSFYESVTFQLLGISRRFFLDSGYGVSKMNSGLMGRLLSEISGGDFSDFIIAANQDEFGNLCREFGLGRQDQMENARALASLMSARAGMRIDLLLHEASFSTLVGPDAQGPQWVVPSLEVHVKRRTNAGDTFAGAFLAAYDATGDPALSAFYANAAAAKRLVDDELPNPANAAQFLRMARLRAVDIPGAKPLCIDELRERKIRESSVYMRASPVSARPALQSAK